MASIGLLESVIVAGSVLLVCGTPLLSMVLALLFGLKRRGRF